MKLLCQSDDYGISEAVSLGILSAIKEGIVRNTGIFVNMPWAKQCADWIKDVEHINLGIDINLVAGKAISDPKEVSAFVNEQGDFLSSTTIMKHFKVVSRKGMITVFEEDPYPYDQVYREMKRQVEKFIELIGRKPAYLHPHSLISKNTYQALQDIAKEYELRFTLDFLVEHNIAMINNDWNPKPFPLEDQFHCDVETHLLEALKQVDDRNYAIHIFHCGYLDRELCDVSTFSAIRMQDLYAAKSEKIKQFIQEHHWELVCYDDIT